MRHALLMSPMGNNDALIWPRASRPAMNPCIYYHPEAYTTSGPKLMGRNAAGESFLRGFLLHAQADAFWLQVQKLDHARHFQATSRPLRRPWGGRSR
jgi:hypothetical protein